MIGNLEAFVPFFVFNKISSFGGGYSSLNSGQELGLIADDLEAIKGYLQQHYPQYPQLADQSCGRFTSEFSR